jgi:parallel beta-helix repeat protein
LLKRIASGIVLTLFLVSMLTSTFNVQLSKAGEAIHIKTGTMGTQSPVATDWNKTYGGTAIDEVYSVVQTSDGGYALAGYTGSYGAGSYDFWLVKTDSSGTAQWNKTYGGTGADYAYSVVQTSDGGYAIAGWTNSSGAGNFDFWLVKTDSSGTMQWNKTYGGTSIDYCFSLIQTDDGGYALAGHNSDFWLVKTDSSGTAQWNKTYGGISTERAYSVVQTSDGGYAISGETSSYGAGNLDFWLVKTDSSGTAQWNKTYGGANLDDMCSVVQTVDGGYALAGSTLSFGAGGLDFWLVKTDSSGTAQWNKTYGGASYERSCSLIQDSDGGYALAGYTYSFGAGNYDFWLVKTDSSGTAQWNKTYGGTDADLGQSLVKTGDGGYAFAGYTHSFGAGDYDAWLIKLAPSAIYIRADGSVDPSTASIQRNGDLYTLTDNIYNSAGIVIQRDNIIIDGAGYTLQGVGSGNGIDLSSRTNVTIWNAQIKNFQYCIWLYESSNSSISGNNITNSDYGIRLYSYSNYNSISGNSITNSSYEGIDLYSSSNNSISGNNLINNSYRGIELVSSSNNSISGNSITNTSYTGIVLVSSSNNSINANNLINNSDDGIELDSSSNYNSISGNSITNSYDSIWIYSSSNNSISGNNLTNNSYGILLGSSSNSSISGNNLTNNSYGIYVYYSSNNHIYHNNFINNTRQVYIEPAGYANVWDDGYPSGGNYWSDYTGTDLFRGAYQNITESDGIGDTHYTIDTNNTDNYPLMGTFGSPTPKGENVTVFPTEDVDLTFDNVTTAGSTTVNKTSTGPEPPSGFEIAGQYYDIQTTASYSGQIEVRIIYDDSGMTQAAEEALRLRQWNVTEWVDITTYVDTVNNVIYGVAPHLSMFGVTSIAPLPDGIAVLGSVCSKTVVGEGYSVTINVTVRNQGDFPKTFDVFAYANGIIIGKETVSDLAPSGQVTLTFTWSTSGFAKGVYTVSASDQLVSVVAVTIPGDVTGDFKVKLEDLTSLLDAFGSTRGADWWYRHTSPCIYCPHNPNNDIDWDAKVALSDITAALDNFGKTYP